MKSRLQTLLIVLVLSLLLLTSCGSPTPPSAQPASTPGLKVPEAQLKLVRTIDGGANPFSSLAAIKFDSQGNLYVLESFTNRIQVFDSSGRFLRMWGNQGSGNGEFNLYSLNPELYAGGLAIDSSDNVYVADSLNYRIQKFKSDGTYINQWGVKGKGDGQFLLPTDVAVDPHGDIYVVDADGGNIQKFDANGNFLLKITQDKFGGGALNMMAIGTDGKMYVGDTYRPSILVFKDGTYTTNFMVDKQPVDLALDGKGNLYVSFESLVVKFDPTGKPVYQIQEPVVPVAVAVDSNGLIYVADSDAHIIKVFQEP